MTKFRYGMTMVLAAFLLGCQNGEAPSSDPETGMQASDQVLPEETRTAEITLEQAGLTVDDLASDDMSEAEKAAIDLFLYQEGEWHSTWTYLDSDGNVTGSVEGTETFSFLVDRYSQMLTNVIPALKHTSYAMLSFNPAEQHIVFMNIGAKGDYWVMRRDPLTGVMISDPHLNIDGTETVLMFTRIKKTPNEMEIVMERSVDGGSTWQKGYVQNLMRVTGE